MLTKDTKLRFWCQKVLPLVYDDSLSYYELLNKVVLHLNQHTEDINQLIDFYDTFAEEVEDVIQQMIEDGDFNEIVADTLGGIIAEEYDPTESYIIFDYCIFQGKLYRANGSTTGVFDPEKWVERTVGYDLTTIQNYIYSLNAGNVSYDESSTYESGTIGKEIQDLNEDINSLDAGQVSYDDTETYENGTIGKEIGDLKDTVSGLTADDVANDSNVTGTKVKDALNTLNGAINDINIFKLPTTTLTDTNLDTVLTDGVYIIGSGCTNTPPTNAEGKLIVMHSGNNNYTRQIFVCGYSIDIYTRQRRFTGGAFNWQGWAGLDLSFDAMLYPASNTVAVFNADSEYIYIVLPNNGLRVGASSYTANAISLSITTCGNVSYTSGSITPNLISVYKSLVVLKYAVPDDSVKSSKGIVMLRNDITIAAH